MLDFNSSLLASRRPARKRAGKDGDGDEEVVSSEHDIFISRPS